MVPDKIKFVTVFTHGDFEIVESDSFRSGIAITVILNNQISNAVSNPDDTGPVKKQMIAYPYLQQFRELAAELFPFQNVLLYAFVLKQFDSRRTLNRMILRVADNVLCAVGRIDQNPDRNIVFQQIGEKFQFLGTSNPAAARMEHQVKRFYRLYILKRIVQIIDCGVSR